MNDFLQVLKPKNIDKEACLIVKMTEPLLVSKDLSIKKPITGTLSYKIDSGTDLKYGKCISKHVPQVNIIR